MGGTPRAGCFTPHRWNAFGLFVAATLNSQVLQLSSVTTIAPFLDPARDVVTSLEQTRHRLLALNCLAPGASTLITNLLRCTGQKPRG
jgi:hypothetical protein